MLMKDFTCQTIEHKHSVSFVNILNVLYIDIFVFILEKPQKKPFFSELKFFFLSFPAFTPAT